MTFAAICPRPLAAERLTNSDLREHKVILPHFTGSVTLIRVPALSALKVRRDRETMAAELEDHSTHTLTFLKMGDVPERKQKGPVTSLCADSIEEIARRKLAVRLRGCHQSSTLFAVLIQIGNRIAVGDNNLSTAASDPPSIVFLSSVTEAADLSIFAEIMLHRLWKQRDPVVRS